jgi:hypothetical protein
MQWLRKKLLFSPLKLMLIKAHAQYQKIANVQKMTPSMIRSMKLGQKCDFVWDWHNFFLAQNWNYIMPTWL